MKDKDNLDAEVKSEEKLRKIKKNTKLFNDIIKNSLMMVKFVISTSQSIHLIKWKNVMEEMPVQEPGYGSIDLTDLINNKKLGGKRSIPQEQSELRKETKKEKTMQMCPECEFVSHNETYFNEHMTTVHAKLRKETEQEKVMRKCPQCDFISQNET